MIMLAANFVWHGVPVDVVVAAGDRPRKKALDWLMKFSSEKKRLLIYQVDEEWFAFGPPAFHSDPRRFRPRYLNESAAARNRGRPDRLLV